MTILLAHVSDDHAFLAADSCRWDVIQNRKRAPVRKLHAAGRASAFAVGGSNIDRDEFARQLSSSRAKGATFSDAARACAPDLFREKMALMRANGVSSPQLLIVYYAEVRRGSCKIIRHQLSPNQDHECEIKGFYCDGPDTAWLSSFAETKLSLFMTDEGLALDAWAFDIIGHGARRHPMNVAYPAMAVMIRSDGSMATREDLHPDCWQGARPEFAAIA
ncbi:hypothetical protein [Sphingobium sp. DC-2]|uniref:hypothetical protein n=1 Tax=Sphingobium sp. DC-2 TaxID=1303256 RepID=UPI0012DCDFAF|nr:hypothetical protein [Sphingobium sp. DC-2]